jgi:hypothetical protein
MFTIYVWIEKWEEFIPLARKLRHISEEEAQFLKDCADLEWLAKVICYFGDEIQIMPHSSLFKVVGPPGHELPRWSGATYECV